MAILSVENLSHSFGEKELYKDASFELNRGEHMGVVGQNGTGKSTLLKILLGEIVATGGRVVWQGRLAIGSIDQYAELDPRAVIADYLRTAYARLYEAERELLSLYERMGQGKDDPKLGARAARLQEMLEESGFYEIENRVARVATGLGLTALGLHRPLGELSGGQRTKVILAKLLLEQPDALLLDEPTNFLDAEHIAWLCEYLAGFPGCLIVVSHDFAFLEKVTNCIVDIEFQMIRKYHGKYSDFVRQKEQRRADYVRRYGEQQKEAAKLEDYIAKNKARASTARMAKSRQKKLDKMERLAPPSVLPAPRIAFRPSPLNAQRALETDSLLVGYDAPLLPRLRFSIEVGRKVVITGFNGIGKSTLIKTLVGKIPSLGGSFAFAPLTKVGYFEQDLAWEDGERTPLQILSGEYPMLHPKQVRRELARCGVTAEHAMQPISTLSGGEQNKVKLCRMTLNPYSFLILDEPTNHLDAETKEALKEAIEGFAGTVLLVCHETAFYRGWADRVIDIEKLLA